MSTPSQSDVSLPYWKTFVSGVLGKVGFGAPGQVFISPRGESHTQSCLGPCGLCSACFPLGPHRSHPGLSLVWTGRQKATVL